tara:strand:- start:209 stop:613 length:405 start_codon:yes stop_codon:yes gene_type:complete
MIHISKSNLLKKRIIDKKFLSFIYFGFFNTLLTNLILQLLLLFTPTIFATLMSQIFNFNFGYYFYGKKVFGIKSLKNIYFLKYILLNVIIWNLNWIVINNINSYNISKNIASLILIPFLALISFVFQKRFVFSK